MLEVELGRLEPQAKIAWRAREYDGFVRLLTPVADALSPVERKKYELAASRM